MEEELEFIETIDYRLNGAKTGEEAVEMAKNIVSIMTRENEKASLVNKELIVNQIGVIMEDAAKLGDNIVRHQEVEYVDSDDEIKKKKVVIDSMVQPFKVKLKSK